MTMQDYEKLGAFYLGKHYDMDRAATREELVLYDSKDLTTHAVCVGMTGSGKTGLCLTLLEEAAIDGIPAIAIDPKGDLGNLLLTFPQLQAADFQPWVDANEAARHGLTPDQFAKRTADLWRKGLADWGQSPDRIERYRSSADISIYTPGSNAGLPLTVLRSFSAPPPAVLNDADALRECIMSAAGGLLALLGIQADPLRSREHILVSSLLDRAWREGRNLDLGGLIREIQTPPFDRIGVMDLETIFPAADRFELSMRLNNVMASPGFGAWLEGEPLDIQRLLHTRDGRPRLSIISIAHLSDAERMFFVTTLLNEVIAWMRSQPGTSSLRALLYMDEVFGYFPPTANPPSKTPMLTLLKQARAYGLGCVLATQNPVDLDYKGLSNAGTWFLGRLQTERDKARVLDGLEGASSTAGVTFDRQRTEAILSGLGNRVFLMNNVHDDAPTVFQTRWALSYLRGPLTRAQIETLMESRRAAAAELGEGAASFPRAAVTAGASGGIRPVVPPGIEELFLAPSRTVGEGPLMYRPALFGLARVHYVSSPANVDSWETAAMLVSAADGLPDDVWAEADSLDYDSLSFEPAPVGEAQFADLPSELTQSRNYSSWKTALKNALYRDRSLSLYECKALKEKSAAGETEGDFRVRLKQRAFETRDIEVEKLRQKYAPKLASLEERIRKAEQRVEKEKEQVSHQTLSTAMSIGTTLLGALLGRKMVSATNMSRAATSVRSATKIAKEKSDVTQAQENVETLRQQLAELEQQFQADTETLKASFDGDSLEITELPIKPRKSDLTVEQVALVWTPWHVGA
ncbi:MAG: ATP-binding protein, partial [Planctomycetales bacterium]|nr:ATP-binding protein [Planctomycetales bacterium]